MNLSSRSTSATVGIIVFVAACVSPADSTPTRLQWSGDTARVVSAPFGALTPQDDSWPFTRPYHIRARAGYLAVADVSAERIVVFDTAGRILSRVGHKGRGPGELYGTSRVALTGDTMFVAEALNGRVSAFTMDGKFLGSSGTPFSAGALVVRGREVYAGATSVTHYAARLIGNREPTPAFRRQKLAAAHERRWGAALGHDLMAVRADTVWVFDQRTASLCAFATPDGAGRCVALPVELQILLTEYRDRRVQLVEAATRQRVQAAPLAKDLITLGDDLALLLPLPTLPVVLVHVTDGSVTPVVIQDATVPTWVRSARSFAWTGRHLILAGDDGLGSLTLLR